MPFAVGQNTSGQARIPWQDEIAPKTLSPLQAVGFFYYSQNLAQEALRRSNHLLAVETLVGAREVLIALSKGGQKGIDIIHAAQQAGIPLDLDFLRETLAAYIYEMLRGEFGMWEPSEVGYPKYIRLRNYYYKRKPKPNETIKPQVQLDGYLQDQRRLQVGAQMPGWAKAHRPKPRVTAETGPRPVAAQTRSMPKGSMWWHRKILAEHPIPKNYRGYMVHGRVGG